MRLGETEWAERLAELAETHGSLPRVALAARHARALADADGDGLYDVAMAYLDAGLGGCAADAAAQAVTMHDAAGRRGARLSAVELLERIVAKRGIRSPTVVATSLGDGLSERQREVVLLANQGLSNREIADRLFLSVRTVEGHLYRAAHILGGPVRHEG